jgi:hypothetical protein
MIPSGPHYWRMVIGVLLYYCSETFPEDSERFKVKIILSGPHYWRVVIGALLYHCSETFSEDSERFKVKIILSGSYIPVPIFMSQ